MQVSEIVVSAARTFNHPYESYSNLKPAVSLRATLAPGEDPVQATKQLQQMAEGLVEDHKTALLASIDRLQEMTEAHAKAAGLARQIAAAQADLDALRVQFPELPALLTGPATAPTLEARNGY